MTDDHDHHRTNADKRKAQGHLPSFATVSAMYAPEQDHHTQETTHPQSSPIQRQDVHHNLPPSNLPIFNKPAPRPVSQPPISHPLQTTTNNHSQTIENDLLHPLLESNQHHVSDSHHNWDRHEDTGHFQSSLLKQPSSTSNATTSAMPSNSHGNPNSNTTGDTQEYENMLTLAKTMDFEAIKKTQFAYVSGTDFAGRPVIVVCGNIPEAVDPEDLVLYLVHLADPIASGDYVVVYVVLSGGKKPSFGWMKKVYGSATRKYKKNLKQLFIVHPSFFVKGIFQLFRPFISTKFWRKLIYIDDINQLYKYMSPQQVKLPDHVLKQPEFVRDAKPIFGATLEACLVSPMNAGCQLPCIIESTIFEIESRGLQVEGIFRISGNSNRMKQLQDSYDKGIAPDLSQEDIHSVCGILKRYLRALPEPIIPFSLFAPLMNISAPSIPDDIRKAQLQVLLSDIPELQFRILDKLICLSAVIAAHATETKMSSSNMAIVIGPNIMWPERETPIEALSNASSVNTLVKWIIENPAGSLGPGRTKYSDITPSSSS